MSPLTQHHGLTLRTVLMYLCIFVCIGSFAFYVLFQARLLIAGPQISIVSQESVHADRLITLEGQAKNIVRITLNGRQIYTDKYGNFKEALVLENGYTVATLQAEDRYGRVTHHTETFVLTEEARTIN